MAGRRTGRLLLGLGLFLFVLLALNQDVRGLFPRGSDQLDRALRLAIAECRAEDVTRLIERGAGPNRVAPPSPQDGRPHPPGGTVPMVAYGRCDTPETLAALQAGGTDLAPHLQRIALLAMNPPRPLVLDWLLRNGLDADARWPNLEGWETLLHRAARRAQPDLVAVLLERGAAVNPPDSEGLTPLQRVRWMVDRLRQDQADPDEPWWIGDYDPEVQYAPVIAMLQAAGGTE